MTEPNQLMTKPVQSGDIANPLASFTPGRNTKLDALVKSNFNEDAPDAAPEPDPVTPDIVAPQKVEPKTELIKPDSTSDSSDSENADDIFKPIESKPEDSEDDKKDEPEIDPALKEKKEGNASLRQAIEEANSKVKIQTELSERITEENKSLRQKLEEAEMELKSNRERSTIQNPQDHPEVRQILDPIQREIESLADRMTLKGQDGPKFRSLIPQLIENYRRLGKPDSEGYKQRADELNHLVRENFNDRNVDSVIDVMARGAMAVNDSAAKIRDIQDNAHKYQSKQASEQYKNILKDYEESAERTFFNPSPDVRSNDPLNVKVILAGLIENNEQVSERANQIKKFLRHGQLPLPPVDEVEINGMDDAAAAKYLQARSSNHLNQQKKLVAMSGDAYLSMAVLPMVMKELAEAKKSLERFKSGEPKPSDSKSHDESRDDDNIDEKNEVVNIKEFNPGKTNYDFSL